MTTRVQNFNAISGGAVTSLSKTLGTAVSVGDLIVLGVQYGDDVTTASINDATLGANKDSLGNTYSTLGPVDYTVDGDYLYVFYSVATNAGTPTIRIVASSGSHAIKLVGETVTPTGTFTLDQSITSHYNSTPGGTLTSGSQTPTSSAGYAFNVFAGIGSLTTFTAGSGFTFRDETSDGWVIFQDVIYASTGLLTGSATSTASTENAGILALFKDASGGPTTKSDTDTGTLSEQTPAIKLATPTDTATLTEQTPQIRPTAQTDSLTFSETQTVTTSSTVSKTDTDTAALSETTNPPTIGVTDSATLNDTAITLVVTDVQQIPDFTVTEQTPRIGLAPTDSLTFTETQTLTASFIRFVDSDAFGLAEATTPMASISQRDTASLTETQAGTTYILDADTLSQSDAAAITALLTSLDALAFADTETRSIVGGYTGYAKGRLSVGARLAGTATVGTRLAGTTATGSRLKGTTTVQPVGGP